MKTSDANKQSVKCTYHKWVETQSTDPLTLAVICKTCGAKPKGKDIERAKAIVRLRTLLNAGDTVYTTLRHVSRSGMQRVIDLHIIRDNEPRWIGSLAATAMDDRFDDHKQGIVTGGCGMDMGFALVYNLGRVLFPDGFALAKNQYGRNGDKSGFDNDGGYALKQEWL